MLLPSLRCLCLQGLCQASGQCGRRMPPRPPRPRAGAATGQQHQQQGLNGDGQSLLWQAAYGGNISRVRSLLSSGVQTLLLDLPDISGYSPLHAASQEGHAEVARALLSAGARVDMQDNLGCTPLHRAAGAGHLGVLRALLSGGTS